MRGLVNQAGGMKINGAVDVNEIVAEEVVKGDVLAVPAWGNVLTKLANPAVMPGDTANCCSFSRDGAYLAIGTNSKVVVYKREGDTFTKLADLSPVVTLVYGVAFSPDGVYLIAVGQMATYIQMYKRSGDTFSSLGYPASLPSGTAYGCAFSPDGNTLAVTHSGGINLSIYDRAGDVFTKNATKSAEATFGSTTPSGCAFSPDGSLFAMGGHGSPYFKMSKISSTGVFTGMTTPVGTVPNTAKSFAFTPDNSLLVVAGLTSASAPVPTGVTLDGTTVEGSALNSKIVNQSAAVCISPDGKYCYYGADTSGQKLQVLSLRTGVVRKEADLSLPPTEGAVYGVSIAGDGKYLCAVLQASPYLYLYKISSAGAASPEWAKRAGIASWRVSKIGIAMANGSADATVNIKQITGG